MRHNESVPIAPGALPLLGHLGRIGAEPQEFFRQLGDIGPVVRIRLARRTAYVVTSPALVRRILVGGRGEFDKGGPFFIPFTTLLGDGLATEPDSVHRVHRPLVQPAFHRSAMTGYMRRVTQSATRHIAEWDPHQIIEVDREMTALTTGVLTRSLFTDPVSSRCVDRFQRDLPIVLDGLGLRMGLPSIGRFPHPANRRFYRAVQHTTDSIETMIRHRKQSPEPHDDLLTLLLAPEPHADGVLNDELVRGHIWDFMLGGIEPTAALLSWTLHILATFPDHYARVQEEIDTVLAGASPTYQDLARLPQLQNTLTEALRLYPPVWVLSRTTTRACELDGHKLPQGADVIFSSWALHRHSDSFEDADRFDPDRWQPARVGRAQRDGFLAFGAGARKCIGDVFGVAEATAMLAVLLQNRRLQPVPGPRVVARRGMTLRPKGLRIAFAPLTSPKPAQDPACAAAPPNPGTGLRAPTP
ncbi:MULTISPECIES: cytochrome P450 [Streptomyces]|uniref:Cytochrome P450 n=1 Tax=Streptomyces tsukubensis (strain DSM 42081 / NBRC 108919 / NRRL 18488 / 9993) TaxID=1114943 RepID=I2MV24_STRT9|nr:MULTISPECIES: cytochrome P450 [Streptomyces]AZK93118.1 hypothetical protein B7R87_03945 [Streptomyces tsukubensis]EIF88621.1 cytochrome P450 183B1 Cyp183B1 [Streptomyces tsukubensis NRRL18488]MYS63923.1 cytochrome P450 [Streptomyces sp. SID5473]QKM70716.1 cytochrome P450 [Streptomyces tsukubensis NRRL18488]TAI41186.1 cytochrome P450 [Streptomyces tsukubensis]